MTKYGICEQSLVPVRKQPTDQSEMINQLLFGDLVLITDVKDSWYLIVTNHDSYEGWVDNKQIETIKLSHFEKLAKSKPAFLSSFYTKATTLTGESKHLLLGSRLPYLHENSFTIPSGKYKIDVNNPSLKSNITGRDIIDIALKYLGAPYLWGGRSPMGIDCSGFTQIVFMQAGIQLKRDASMQAEKGETINFIDEVEIGDLAFFDNSEEMIIHVGIIIDNKKIIHASGEVRIDNIDHEGIYNEVLKKYTHKLRIIKRIIS